MNDLATKPLDAVFASEVQSTKDYDKFHFMKGNRSINHINLRHITDSMRENPLFTVIIVNENHEIIDGQHRFLALKELGLPMHYIVIQGYGLPEVHILNTNSTNWTFKDYAEGYVSMGLRPYVQFKQLMEEYPEFGVKAILFMIDFIRPEGRNRITERSHKGFQEGRLQITNIQLVRDLAEKIRDYRHFYESYYRRSFVTGVLMAMRNKNYNHEQMIHKLSLRTNQITDQTSGSNYLDQLEYAFNFGSKTKCSLRY